MSRGNRKKLHENVDFVAYITGKKVRKHKKTLDIRLRTS